MSLSEKLWDTLTTVIKMNDKVERMADTVEQQVRIEDHARGTAGNGAGNRHAAPGTKTNSQSRSQTRASVDYQEKLKPAQAPVL